MSVAGVFALRRVVYGDPEAREAAQCALTALPVARRGKDPYLCHSVGTVEAIPKLLTRTKVQSGIFATRPRVTLHHLYILLRSLSQGAINSAVLNV